MRGDGLLGVLLSTTVVIVGFAVLSEALHVGMPGNGVVFGAVLAILYVGSLFLIWRIAGKQEDKPFWSACRSEFMAFKEGIRVLTGRTPDEGEKEAAPMGDDEKT